MLPAQILSSSQPVEMVACGGEVVADLFGPGTFAGHPVARWRAHGDALELEMAAPGEPTADLTEARARLGTSVTLLRPRVRDVLALTATVPGFGWATHAVVATDGPATAVSGGRGWIANEHVRVDVDPATGTLTLTTADGLRASCLNRYVDGGDAGDTYNWSPPAGDHLVDRPDTVAVELAEDGPVRARLVITASYPWAVPTEVRRGSTWCPASRSCGSGPRSSTPIATTGCGPLPAAGAGDGLRGECAFAVVHRGLTHDGNPIEAGLPTYPARRFVDCAPLALIFDGVGEYEVTWP